MLVNVQCSNQKLAAEIVEVINYVQAEILQLPSSISIVVEPMDGTDCGEYDMENNTIRVDPMHNPVSTVIHELVHAEQYYIGWLRSDDNGDFVWFGVTYPDVDTSTEEYRETPWERDAYRREKEIFKKVKKWQRDSAGTKSVSSVKKLLH